MLDLLCYLCGKSKLCLCSLVSGGELDEPVSLPQARGGTADHETTEDTSVRFEQLQQVLARERGREVPDKEEGVRVAVGGTQLAAVVASQAQLMEMFRRCLG